MAALAEKYDQLKRRYVESREKGKAEMTDFLDNQAGDLLRKLEHQYQTIKSSISNMHVVGNTFISHCFTLFMKRTPATRFVQIYLQIISPCTKVR